MIFSKWQGLGNDFILVKKEEVRGSDLCLLAQKLCDRYFGIGADGLVVLTLNSDSTCEMHIYNADGTEAEMCGNASRCVGLYLHELSPILATSFTLKTLAGDRLVSVIDRERVSVQMGAPKIKHLSVSLRDKTFEGISVFVGNPHFVIFVDDVDSIPLEEWGPLIETHPLFPDKTNVEFVQVLDAGHIRMRVWERGCGVTMACGTGSCATVVAAHYTGKTSSSVQVQLDGGDLFIEYNSSKNMITMTGLAKKVFDGTLNLESL